jgi:hypothetical protein
VTPDNKNLDGIEGIMAIELLPIKLVVDQMQLIIWVIWSEVLEVRFVKVIAEILSLSRAAVKGKESQN